MPRGVDIANALSRGIGTGVGVGQAINQRRAGVQAQANYEAETAENQRRYDRAIDKAEAEEAEQQLLAREEGRIQGEQMRLDRSNIPGFDQDAREASAIQATMTSLEKSMGTFKDVGMSNSLQNIVYLALEQSPDFRQTEKYITHITGVMEKLTDPDARDRFLSKQETILELNALESEKGQFERDLQRDVSIGIKYSTAPNPLEATADPAGPGPGGQGQPTGEQAPAGGGLGIFTQSPQLLEGARGALDALNEAWDSAQSTGDIGEIRAVRGMIRQFRVGFQESARNAQVQRALFRDLQSRKNRLDAAMGDAEKRGDERAIVEILEQYEALDDSLTEMVQGGFQVPEGQPQQAQGAPTAEGALAEQERRRAQGGGVPGQARAPAPTAQESADVVLSEAAGIDEEAAALEAFGDVEGAAELRKKSEAARTSPQAKAPERAAKLTVELRNLGFQGEATRGPASSAMAIAKLYQSYKAAGGGGVMSEAGKNVRAAEKLGLTRIRKEHHGKGPSWSLPVAFERYTLTEIIEKYTKFGSMVELQRAYQAEGGDVQQEAPPQAQQPAQLPPLSPGSPVREADVEAPELDLLRPKKPKTLPPGAAGGLAGGRQ